MEIRSLNIASSKTNRPPQMCRFNWRQHVSEDTKQWIDDLWFQWGYRIIGVLVLLMGFFLGRISQFGGFPASAPAPPVPASFIAPEFSCDADAEYARFTKAGGGRETRCPDNSWWLNAFAAIDPSPNKTIIVIGCNKGADAIDLYSMYDNGPKPFNSTLWREAVKTHGGDNGACGQIVNSPDFDRAVFDDRFAATSPSVYCVEPMPANIALLQSCAKSTGINDDFFKIEQYAVGNPDEGQTTISFPDGPPGKEQMRVMDSGGVKVPFKSLDARFGDLPDLDKVDILSIDTEGNDPDAIFGAQSLLAKTRYLEFEVHRDMAGTSWAKYPLKSVIEYLDNLAFDCFWMTGNGELFQITNCWNQQYEKDAKTWSNVVCAKRGDDWHSILTLTRATQARSRQKSMMSKV